MHELNHRFQAITLRNTEKNGEILEKKSAYLRITISLICGKITIKLSNYQNDQKNGH